MIKANISVGLSKYICRNQKVKFSIKHSKNMQKKREVCLFRKERKYISFVY